MNKYEALIFDLDDTLIDNNNSIKYAFLKTLEHLNIPFNDEYFERWKVFDKAYWHIWESGEMYVPESITTLEDKITYLRAQRFVAFFKDLNLNFDSAVKVNEVYCKYLGENIIEISGASRVLGKLKNGYEIIVATNGPKMAALNKIKKIKIDNCVSLVITSEDVGFSKPMPEFFDFMIKKSRVKNKDKMLLIGDGLTTDILGGIKYGIDTCWFNPQMLNGSPDYSPTITINNLNELENILLNKQLND